MTENGKNAKAGANNPSSKLTAEDAYSIIFTKFTSSGAKRGEQARLGRLYKLNPRTVNDIWKGISWVGEWKRFLGDHPQFENHELVPEHLRRG